MLTLWIASAACSACLCRRLIACKFAWEHAVVLHQCRLTLGVASFRFDVIDKDGDKSVSFVEFQRGCDRLGLGLSQSQCTQVSSETYGGMYVLTVVSLPIACDETCSYLRSWMLTVVVRSTLMSLKWSVVVLLFGSDHVFEWFLCRAVHNHRLSSVRAP